MWPCETVVIVMLPGRNDPAMFSGVTVVVESVATYGAVVATAPVTRQ